MIGVLNNVHVRLWKAKRRHKWLQRNAQEAAYDSEVSFDQLVDANNEVAEAFDEVRRLQKAAEEERAENQRATSKFFDSLGDMDDDAPNASPMLSERFKTVARYILAAVGVMVVLSIYVSIHT